MKTSELIDDKLDLAVSICEQVEYWHTLPGSFPPVKRAIFKPSSNWAQGGLIIEREGISVMLSFRDSYAEGANAKPSGWCARKYQYGVLNEPLSHGPTPLIAAMRCYVASKLGDEIELPEEVL